MPRSEVETEAVIKGICRETPTVKSFVLDIKDSRFTFRPGQWVDLKAPTTEVIGGFSIASAPKQLATENSLLLAVKESPVNPPAVWLWEQAVVGSCVQLKVGGSFHYPGYTALPGIKEGADNLVLFIAGGVGINPLFSMVAHMHAEQEPVRAHILYSAHTEEELLFKSQLENLCATPSGCRVTCDFIVTSKQGRITKESLAEAITRVGSPAVSYVCGPPLMIDAVTALLSPYLPDDRILVERWW